MKIACCQYSPAYRDRDGNIETIRSILRDTDADLCVFPELATSGYFFRSKNEISSLAETLDGPSVTVLCSMAREAGKAIVLGFLEMADGVYFNSALAIDAMGKIAGHYRKVHLFYYETQIFSPGNLGFPVFALSTRSGTAMVGIMICYDWRFPEAARELALAGAELIAVPSNIVTTTGMLHATLRTRAFENKVVLAFADRTGTETHGDQMLTFRGESAIINYNGDVLVQASADRSEIIIADIALEATRNKRINSFNDIFSDRSPSGYPSMITQSPNPAKIKG